MFNIIRDYQDRHYYENPQNSSIRFAPLLKRDEETFEELWHPVSCRDKCSDIARIFAYNIPIPNIFGFHYEPIPDLLERYEDADHFYFHITFKYKKELSKFINQYWIINDFERQMGFGESTCIDNDVRKYKCFKNGDILSHYTAIVTMDKRWVKSSFGISIYTFIARLISYLDLESSDKKKICHSIANFLDKNEDDCDSMEDYSYRAAFLNLDFVDIIKNIDEYTFNNPTTYADDSYIAKNYHEKFKTYEFNEYTTVSYKSYILYEYLEFIGYKHNLKALPFIKIIYNLTPQTLHCSTGFSATYDLLERWKELISYSKDYEIKTHQNNLALYLLLKYLEKND